MAQNGNGSRISAVTKETLLPISMLVLIATMVWAAASDRAQLKSDVHHLQQDVAKLTERLEYQQQKLSDYRAQVDEYRTADLEQGRNITRLEKRLDVHQERDHQ